MRQFTTNYFKEVHKKARQKQMPDAVKVHQIKRERDSKALLIPSFSMVKVYQIKKKRERDR